VLETQKYGAAPRPRTVRHPVFTEEGLAAIGTVTSLRRVYLGHTKTNLAGAWKMVAGLTNLEDYVPGVFTTHIMLASVTQRPSLRELSFGAHWAPIGDPTVTLAGYISIC